MSPNSPAVVGAHASKPRAHQTLDAASVLLPVLPGKAAPTATSIVQFLNVTLSPRIDITRFSKPSAGAAGIAARASTAFAAEPKGFAVNGVSAVILTQFGATEAWYATVEAGLENVARTIVQARRAVDHHATRYLRKIEHVIVTEKDAALAARWAPLHDYLAEHSAPNKAARAASAKRKKNAGAAAAKKALAGAPAAAAPKKKRASAPLAADAVAQPVAPAGAAPTTEAIALFVGVPLAPHLDTTRFTRALPGSSALLGLVAQTFAAEGPNFGVNGVSVAALRELEALATWFTSAEAAVTEALRSIQQDRAAIDHHLIRALRKIVSTVDKERHVGLSGRWDFLIKYLAQPKKKPPVKVAPAAAAAPAPAPPAVAPPKVA